MTSNEEKNKLTFIQHNVNRSSPAHYSLLQQAFENTSTDIILIQEPYVAYNKLQGNFICISHSSFHTAPPIPMLSNNIVSERPCTLTYIWKSSCLQFSPRYDLCQDTDMQIIELTMEPESFFIINIYNEKQRFYVDSFMTESRSNPLYAPRYTVDRLLLPAKTPTSDRKSVV